MDHKDEKQNTEVEIQTVLTFLIPSCYLSSEGCQALTVEYPDVHIKCQGEIVLMIPCSLILVENALVFKVI